MRQILARHCHDSLLYMVAVKHLQLTDALLASRYISACTCDLSYTQQHTLLDQGFQSC